VGAGQSILALWRRCSAHAGAGMADWRLGGGGLFLVQAAVAVLLVELVDYIQHYGLTRRHLGNGQYEHTREWHSWNSSRRGTGYLLINLQRHSDHHFKPKRRYPVLQSHPREIAPQLPYGYPMMVAFAVIPPLWRWKMNWRVIRWRGQHYPDVTDWPD
jgi:alkane 1-monooxygenase